MQNLSGKVALVTGGSSGLGEAAALEFARQGARVAIAARRADRSAEVVRRIEALGGEAHFLQTDVTKSADVEAMVAGVLSRFGRLDCAVNNAGIAGTVLTPAADITEEAWDAVLDTNLKAVFVCMKYEIPAMLQNGGGAIVNISSIYGIKPSDAGHAPYCASKYGLIGLSQTAAIDYGQQGIRINVIAPGFTKSEMVVDDGSELWKTIAAKHSGMKRLGEAEETASAIVWLCTDGARFVNGAVLPVDGGTTSRLY